MIPVYCAHLQDEIVPILTIRLELIENEVAFRPPLDQSTSYTSVQETIRQWLDSFLARGRLVTMLSGKVGHEHYMVWPDKSGHVVVRLEVFA